MTDMLVKLYDLPDFRQRVSDLAAEGLVIRRAMAYEKLQVVDWVKDAFGPAWASEADVAFGRSPVACFIALDPKNVCGFACYESTCKNFFGPIGVMDSMQKKGIGQALLLSCLDALKAMGYAYAVIGDAGPDSFFEKAANAVSIPGSSPGIYKPAVSVPRKK